ncbi:hypothetical protein CO059_01865 [candidate division WWE3 bacterium CG_4_9_14_0_2_um_filter_48_10]|uniref:Uncharacterized protein n=1 Tax=candidate division WWE3 bacterium CG_4_9_14_0_2_um_filter_48_10 TaxID=1975078 RepID=A0A2M8EJ05_UNCKA|nr:MAG: hypothetical protein CO059_01865 [candidate division WWE3 bacterium CG_4_9_14_0_2_um_filter_48_10]
MSSIKKLLEKLKKLNLPKDKFAIFCSGPLGVRGIRPVNDLDIIVTRDLWRELAKEYPTEKLSLPTGQLRINFKGIEIFEKPAFGFDAEKLIKEADVIDGFRFVRLKDTVAWKKKMGREKDLEDIKLIGDYLRRFGQV